MQEIHCPEISFTENKREKRNIGITGEGITAAPEILPQIPDIRSIGVSTRRPHCHLD